MALKKKIKRCIFGAIIICLLLLIYSFIEPYWVEIKESVFYSKDIPAGFDGLKIVFAADIHHGPFFSRDRVKQTVNKINKLNPDIILLGGDYVYRDPKYIGPCFEELKSLRAPMGVYGVLGNHDHWESTDLSKKGMDNANIEMLDNSSKWIYNKGQRIKIGGVGDMFTDIQDLSPTIDDVEESDFVILLSHSPDYVEHINTKKVDIVLSGHTHGGQFTLFGLWAAFIPSYYGNKYRAGEIKTNATTLFVTNGIGTITLPARFFARPQINVIYLKRER